MSRMIAEPEASNYSTIDQWTSHHPFLESPHDEIHPTPQNLNGSWSTAESFSAPNDLNDFMERLLDSDSSRIGLMHCCEEISEQLLQIREELQFDDSSSEIVKLRVFGD